jgi:Tfp pilus assembly protein PilX
MSALWYSISCLKDIIEVNLRLIYMSSRPEMLPNYQWDRSQQGFATVVALGLGLALTLIGVMMVTRSQSDVSTASSQRATAKSLAAAETGIVRFQTLIDRHRAIATYPACGDASFITTGTCSDTTNPSWFNSY